MSGRSAAGFRPGLVERLFRRLQGKPPLVVPPMPPRGPLSLYPPVDSWDHWEEYDAAAWPRRVKRTYTLVPTACFNCEAACGLLAYVDKETGRIRRFEGNPLHPGSRGRNCAKGPATINQIDDPERILHPLRRAGRRGEERWERVSWDEALDDIAGRIRKALKEGRHNEIMYHVGRPGHERYIERVLKSWGIDGHNSHTNVCSASARLGYQLWTGSDRPSPDHANARLILLLSSHLETGHYFNPHAQRIMEGKMRGARLVVIDPRLSNTASMADDWLPSRPGSEAALLLAMARVILEEDLLDRRFVERWVNWRQCLRAEHPGDPETFDGFLIRIRERYAAFTPEMAEAESGVPAADIVRIAREIARAGSAFAAHIWRGAASGNLGGWQVARALQFLSVLVGAVGTPGGTSPAAWNKFSPKLFAEPPAQTFWNELLFPREYPLGHYEMSFLLPHFLLEGRGRLDVYFTRVYNPVWTNPDGFTWIEALSDESKVGCHVALTPTWSETALYADYVLPMGHAGERHDIQSQETHAGVWFSFRQPVLRAAAERAGRKTTFTHETNPGEVWEEDEFWIELSWRIDPDGSLGVRRWFESPYRPGAKVTVEEYYRWIFENAVPGLPEAAQALGMTPLEYMRRFGAFEVRRGVYALHESPVPSDQLEGAEADPATGVVRRAGTAIGVLVDGVARRGFDTPSRKLEIHSAMMKDWKWPELAMPGYTRSHVHHETIDPSRGELLLLPTFRLPTMIHTRSGNAKWLNEISHRNPVLIHTSDAARLAVRTGDLVRVTTEIGFFVNRVYVTEGIRPGVVACSHHMGRWRTSEKGGSRWAAALVSIQRSPEGVWRMRHQSGIEPFDSDDPDSSRIWWREPGVHQNITFPVHPDPVSGMHCWHQKVRVERARPDDRYGDIEVDTRRSMEVYRRWLAMARPAPGPAGLRRPLWLARPVRPAPETFKVPEDAASPDT
ncbi:MAG TPA: molybdopterin-dependent oxidoreductase [Candidatus Polarisedimenticolia bacterium]|nr:molybdopterin-dependent oxidoreductase [Candidatus Polarisedimenticolia bacterium]